MELKIKRDLHSLRHKTKILSQSNVLSYEHKLSKFDYLNFEEISNEYIY